jgi:hypothetical protein
MTQQSLPELEQLTGEQWATLQAIADVIVPPSAKYAVPGAGDPAICSSVVNDASTRLPKLLAALAKLNTMAREAHENSFAELTDTARGEVALSFQRTCIDDANMLQLLVTQCYYRDDRVLASLGMEQRPPFPAGYAVDPGDWSILDPVRSRGSIS